MEGEPRKAAELKAKAEEASDSDPPQAGPPSSSAKWPSWDAPVPIVGAVRGGQGSAPTLAALTPFCQQLICGSGPPMQSFSPQRAFSLPQVHP